MNRILPAVTLAVLLASCSASKDYLAHQNEDKTLFNIIKQLNKKPGDELATAALPVVYAQLQQTHQANIVSYSNNPSLSRFDKINNEYYILQEMYTAISNAAAASSLITAVNYQNRIDSNRMEAAAAYFQLATEQYNSNNREGYRKAYSSFKKADSWVDNYQNSEAMMDSARQHGIVSIVINPVHDNSYYYNTGWNNGFDLTPAGFSQNLIADMGGKSAGRYPAKFYSDWLAQRDSVTANWIADLTLKNVNIPSASTYNYTRNLSTKVEDGRDTAGRIQYKTVTATLYIQRKTITAYAQMDMSITDAASQKNTSYDTFNDSYNWQQEVASYTGDSRALNNRDWELVNNRYYQPAREEIVSELYRGLYPQVKNRLSAIVSW